MDEGMNRGSGGECKDEWIETDDKEVFLGEDGEQGGGGGSGKDGGGGI